jgi:hypothetical protein
MKKYIQLILSKTFFIGFTFLFLIACKKDTAVAELNVTSKLLSDKTWYLDYAIITSAGNTTNKSYVGQSTYSINFLNNSTTTDSDGLAGVYSVEKINGQLQIHVQVKTNNGNKIEYIYNIESIGAKHLVLYYTTGQILTKQYFSVK